MKVLFARKLDLHLGSLDFLGSCMTGGRAYYFLRSENGEFALVAREKQAHEKAFKVGRQLAFEYRTYPDGGAGPLAAALLERFVASLLKREEAIWGTLTRAEDDAMGGSGLTILAASSVDETTVFRLAAGEVPVGTLTLGPRERFPLALFHWSARFDGLDGEPARELSGRMQQFFLSLVARQMAGGTLPSVHEAEPDKRRTPVFIYLDLDRPAFNARNLDALEVLEGDNVVVSIEVPSRCRNRCVFCAPQEGLSKAVNRSAESVVEQVGKLLKSVRPHLELAGRTDAVLVGQDAFNSPALLPLLALLRQEPHLTRMTVVSPGTRLADPAFVQRLKENSLDVANLTILGPDHETHDLVAGRAGAFADLLASIENLKDAGIGWELNTVLVNHNLKQLPQTVRKAVELGTKPRIYNYVSEPFVPLVQAGRCAPPLRELRTILEEDRELFENHLGAIHYVPLCVLPDWARTLAGHSSQSFPDPPESTPEPCSRCEAYQNRCGSVGQHYLELYGSDELSPVNEA